MSRSVGLRDKTETIAPRPGEMTNPQTPVEKPKKKWVVDPLERRACPRFVALEYRAWVAWWDDTEFQATACRLLDISKGGVLLESAEPPPQDRSIWFCLHPAHWAGRIEAMVVEATERAPGCHRVRVAFFEPCPKTLFEIAREGFRR